MDIMIIDDSPHDGKTIKRVLESHGWEVVWHKDPRAAVAFFQKPDAPLPKVVLVDLKMPRINGFKLMALLRERYGANLPLVVISNSDDPADIAKSYSTGCNAYVSKPVELQQFKDTFTSVGKFWADNNRHP